MSDRPRSHDALDLRFEALGRLARAAASVEPEAAAAASARARFIAGAGEVTAARTRRWRLWVAGPALVAVGAVAALLVAPRFRALPYQVVGGAGAPASGAGSLLGAGTTVRFADGTELRLEDDGSGRVTETSRAGARLVLEEGRMHARVVPRPGARWTVEAGPFLVRVTGTEFAVGWKRREGRFEISMTTGSVTVDGPRFSQRLGAGQRLVATRDAGIVQLARAPEAAAGAGPLIVPLDPEAPVAPPAEARAPGRPGAAARASWSSRVARGELASVVDEARAGGMYQALAERSADDLSALGTAARLTGKVALARRALLAQRSRFPGSAAGREAAFYLGRIAEDLERDRTAAIVWYDRYLGESPRGALAEECLGRKLRALAAGGPGELAAARPAARLYLRRFPAGAHAALARDVLERGRTGGDR